MIITIQRITVLDLSLIKPGIYYITSVFINLH